MSPTRSLDGSFFNRPAASGRKWEITSAAMPAYIPSMPDMAKSLIFGLPFRLRDLVSRDVDVAWIYIRPTNVLGAYINLPPLCAAFAVASSTALLLYPMSLKICAEFFTKIPGFLVRLKGKVPACLTSVVGNAAFDPMPTAWRTLLPPIVANVMVVSARIIPAICAVLAANS